MNEIHDYNPLITVYIPTFNRVDLLKRAVESVRNQTYQNLEIIVVDDCSTDETHEYLKNIANKDHRVSYHLKNENSGACVSRNIAIETAKGFFITGLDDDDYFEEDRIETFLNKAIKSPDYIYFTTHNTKVSKEEIRPPKWFTLLKKSRIKKPSSLLRKNYIGNQIFVKTSYLKQSGGFDPKLRSWQDLECWFNLMKTQKIEARMIKSPTQTIDISHEHERITNKDPQKLLSSFKYIVKKHKLKKFNKLLFENQVVRHLPEEYTNPKKLLMFFITGNRYHLFSIFRNR